MQIDKIMNKNAVTAVGAKSDSAKGGVPNVYSFNVYIVLVVILDNYFALI
jgi:hypothetical protein